MVLCLTLMFSINNDVDAYVIRGIFNWWFEACENTKRDCLVFCYMKSARFCARRCEGMFYYCAAECSKYLIRRTLETHVQ